MPISFADGLGFNGRDKESQTRTFSLVLHLETGSCGDQFSSQLNSDDTFCVFSTAPIYVRVFFVHYVQICSKTRTKEWPVPLSIDKHRLRVYRSQVLFRNPNTWDSINGYELQAAIVTHFYLHSITLQRYRHIHGRDHITLHWAGLG